MTEDAVIKEAFEQMFSAGQYQYSQENKQNAYGWFKAGYQASTLRTTSQDQPK